jgi:hypothetical protein
MVIITSYFDGETYGILGPQMAASLISAHTPYDCIVIAVCKEDRLREIKKVLHDYFRSQRPIIGFSTLSGREDLFALAGELTSEGAFTILAGPQADVDFSGEHNWRQHRHRFKGQWPNFSIALQGPAEQLLPVLNAHNPEKAIDLPGVLHLAGQAIQKRPPLAWNPEQLKTVDWDNLFRIKAGQLVAHKIKTAQVLQQIGCPYASRIARISIDFPSALGNHSERAVDLNASGCTFCDVAVDKGFHGNLANRTVMAQIAGLPENADGRKIAFELINEYPLPRLGRILEDVKAHGIMLSQISLTLRADGLVNHVSHLRNALKTAASSGTRIIMASVGFESFDDRILRNLNKGIDVALNLAAIHVMRQLKSEYPNVFGYLRAEGGNHGYIHPTPWDTPETENNIHTIIHRYGLDQDILPTHSTPLIIHHAAVLGDWIRMIEKIEAIRLKRYGAIIGWWDIGAI